MTASETRTRKQWSDEALTKFYVPGLRVVDAPPAGYREMSELIDATEKSLRFRYYNWRIWLPKSHVVQIKNAREFWASYWSVDRAKETGEWVG